MGQIDHVLGAMSPDDMKEMDHAVERAASAVRSLVSDGITEAMNKFN